MLGLVVPSVANPFWGTFAQLVESIALRSGFRVLLCNSERDPEREYEYLEELWADGIGHLAEFGPGIRRSAGCHAILGRPELYPRAVRFWDKPWGQAPFSFPHPAGKVATGVRPAR